MAGFASSLALQERGRAGCTKKGGRSGFPDTDKGGVGINRSRPVCKGLSNIESSIIEGRIAHAGYLRSVKLHRL